MNKIESRFQALQAILRFEGSGDSGKQEKNSFPRIYEQTVNDRTSITVE
jgi:hypothetical protein